MLRREWAPAAYVVSFKLETDERLLEASARGALRRYGVHAVVANELQSRAQRVLLVTPGATEELRDGGGGGGGQPLDAALVAAVVRLHGAHVGAAAGARGGA